MPANNGYEPSYLVQYLPEIYQQEAFLGRFLRIFEDVLAPIERMLDSMHGYFDPSTTPPEVLEWLATWLGISTDERWPLARRRMFVRRANQMFQLRGTKKGLSIAVEALTGNVPSIVQPTVAELSADPTRQFSFRITVEASPGEVIDQQALEQLIELEKPAFTAYALEIIPAPGAPEATAPG